MRYEEDIYIKTAEETGHSVEIVKFVVKHFWKTAHFYLRNPLAAGKKIQITSGLMFKVRPYKIGYMIGSIEDDIEQYGTNEYLEAKLHYLNELAKQHIEYEGSARERIEDGRRSCLYKRQRARQRSKERADNSA